MFSEAIRAVLRFLGAAALGLVILAVLAFVFTGGPRQIVQYRSFERIVKTVDRAELLAACVGIIRTADTNEVSFRAADRRAELPSAISALGDTTIHMHGDSLTVDFHRRFGDCGFLVRKVDATWKLEWHDEGHVIPLAEMRDESADRSPEVASTEDGEPEG